jgi:hypothetical protein
MCDQDRAGPRPYFEDLLILEGDLLAFLQQILGEWPKGIYGLVPASQPWRGRQGKRHGLGPSGEHQKQIRPDGADDFGFLGP